MNEREIIMIGEAEQESINELTELFRQRLTKNYLSLRDDFVRGKTNEERFNYYADVICDYYCLERDRMMSKETRKTEYKTARQTLWWFCRTGESSLPFSLGNLGAMTSLKGEPFDHATVLHGVRKIEDDVRYNFDTRYDVRNIGKLLGFILYKTGTKYTTNEKVSNQKEGLSEHVVG